MTEKPNASPGHAWAMTACVTARALLDIPARLHPAETAARPAREPCIVVMASLAAVEDARLQDALPRRHGCAAAIATPAHPAEIIVA